MYKRDEHDVKLLESREDSSESLQSPEQALDFVPAPVHGLIVLPGVDSVLLRRHDRDESKIQGKLARFIALIGTVHDQVHRPSGRSEFFQQLTTLRAVVRLT